MSNENLNILSNFGEIFINYNYDYPLSWVDFELEACQKNKKFMDLYSSLDNKQYKLLKIFIEDLIRNNCFTFLKMFEENQQFQIQFNDGIKEIDLMTLSENLKGEAIFEDGWIDKFSKYSNKNKESI